MTATDEPFIDLYVEDEEHLGQWRCARCGAPLAYDPVVGLYCAGCDLEHEENEEPDHASRPHATHRLA